jgi:hypothetical protein
VTEGVLCQFTWRLHERILRCKKNARILRFAERKEMCYCLPRALTKWLKTRQNAVEKATSEAAKKKFEFRKNSS